MLTRIAPSFAVPYWTKTHSAQFGAQMPTRSPLPTPRASSPSAQASTSATNSRIGPAAAGGALDQRLVVAHPRRRPIQVRPDRVAQQGDRRGPAAVGRQRGRAHCCASRTSLHAGPVGLVGRVRVADPVDRQREAVVLAERRQRAGGLSW